MKHRFYIIAACLVSGLLGINAILADNMFVYDKENNIVYQNDADSIDRVALENEKTDIAIYAKGANNAVYTGKIANISNISIGNTPKEKPVADILDVVFNEDGTATDVSPMKNEVKVIGQNSGKLSIEYSPIYHRNMAVFDNTWAGSTQAYYRIDYANNQKIKNALADGHTLEAIVMANYDGEIIDGEAKFLSSHETGGTGLYVCKAAKGKNGKNELCFLPHVGGAWRHASSGIVPVPKKYYHVVGVWNKEEGKDYIYIDGELMNTADAKGDFKFPKDNSNWFAIGCDAGPSGQLGWKGNVVTAKIYDKPLDAEEVASLWNEVKAGQEKPVADILDVQFNEDGTATDLSPMKLTVEAQANGTQEVYFNQTYQRYVARFNNTWGGALTGKYKIDFENNQKVRDALADGHTLEALVMADNENATADNKEAKFFSAQQAGGTGLMVCRVANSQQQQPEYTFLTNNDGWKFVPSGIFPTQKVFRHIVGVWNKEEGKSYIYIDGVLKNTLDVPAELKFANAGSNWFAIGGDSDGSNGGNGWIGDVAIARIYDKPLTQNDIDLLWNDIKTLQNNAQEELATDIKYNSGFAVKTGQTFRIEGKGFQTGDKLTLTSEDSNVTDIEGTASDSDFSFAIPASLRSGKYRMNLVRGESKQDLGTIKFEVVTVFPKAPGVVAHRGYWDTEGSAQNSRASVKKAQELGTFGSETDVWLTTDGYLVLNHDATINGITIQNSAYDKIKDMKLSNGETLPQLKDVLELLTDKSKTTKLFIEVKVHNSDAKNKAVAKAIVDEVKKYDVQDRVQYISFSVPVLREVLANDPNAKVAFLGGGVAPADLHKDGINMHYSQNSYRDNPTWIKEAHNLGMEVNVQGVNTDSDAAEMINMGADLISTDKPVAAMKVRQYYIDHQEK